MIFQVSVFFQVRVQEPQPFLSQMGVTPGLDWGPRSKSCYPCLCVCIFGPSRALVSNSLKSVHFKARADENFLISLRLSGVSLSANRLYMCTYQPTPDFARTPNLAAHFLCSLHSDCSKETIVKKYWKNIIILNNSWKFIGNCSNKKYPREICSQALNNICHGSKNPG